MKIPSEVMDVLRVAAPTLATAFGGPLAGAAAAVAASALERYLSPSATSPALPGMPVLPPSPAEVVRTIQQNSSDPQFLLQLKIAEIELQKYERDLDFKFADLVLKDRQSSRDFQEKTDIAKPLMHWGMTIIVLSLGSLFLVVIGSLLLIAGFVKIPAETVQMAVGVFGLIGSITGLIGGFGMQIAGFYWGDSAASQGKTQALSEALQTSGAQLGQAAATASKAAEVAAAKPVAPAPQVVVVPAQPAAPAEAAPAAVAWRQGPFGGARWQVLPDGVLVEGDPTVARTVGEPVTVRRVWQTFGPILREVSARYGVPVEVAVMVICTESKGLAGATLQEPDGRTSSGLMQVLTGTASEMLGRPVSAEDLKNPQTSIEAGVAYIAHQKKDTWFDPILTAAAYNAGGIYEPRRQDTNRFNLRCTGDHLERAIRWYGDVCFVAKADNWFGNTGNGQ